MAMASFWNSDFIQNFPFINEINFKTLLVLIFTLVVTIFLFTGKRKRNLPRGPLGVPFFGYLPFLGKEPFKTFHLLGKKYGGIFGLYLGRRYVVILNDWDAMKDAFSKSAAGNKPPALFELMPCGFGFSDANGSEWNEQRKFTMKTMKDLGLGGPKWEELVQEEINDLISSIEEAKGRSLDVCQLLFSTFANNMMSLCFGKRLPFGHPDAEFVSECVDAIMKTFPAVSLGNFMPSLNSLLNKFGIGETSKLMKQLKDLSQYIRKIIEEKKKDTSDSKEDYISEYYRQMENNMKNNVNSYFTERNLQGNIHSLMAGGAETVRTSLIWVLLAMAQEPETQKKVQEELDRVVGKDGRITWGDRRKIPYTYATMMEALRWRSVIPISSAHMIFEDIEVCGYDIPRGSIILGNNWSLHNDSRYWPEPEKFNPERFLVNQGTEINFKPDSYAPFSYGKRYCPGELVALMEFLSYFTALMQKFLVLPPEDGLKYGTSLGLSYQATGLKLRFVPRD